MTMTLPLLMLFAAFAAFVLAAIPRTTHPSLQPSGLALATGAVLLGLV